ncbi:MAG: lmo0937 family membrane protein [Mucilaginibacter sp.]
MRALLYIIAVILVIGWAIGVFAYSAGGLIYALLVLAIIAFLLGIIRRSSTGVDTY